MDKRLDHQGRRRNKVVAFRVSQEESKLIDRMVRLSGLTKQDYIIRRLQCQDIVVQGNPRVYKALRDQMVQIHQELKRVENASELSEEFLYTLQLVAITLNGMKEENE
ncbi:MAG: plasmid mobilization protein [Clostridium sp.]